MAAVNSVGDFIKSVFPSIVNKSGKVFKALLTDGEGGGTIESVFCGIEETRRAWAKDGSVYSQDGETRGRLLLDLKDLISRRPLRVCSSQTRIKTVVKSGGVWTQIYRVTWSGMSCVRIIKARVFEENSVSEAKPNGGDNSRYFRDFPRTV